MYSGPQTNGTPYRCPSRSPARRTAGITSSSAPPGTGAATPATASASTESPETANTSAPADVALRTMSADEPRGSSVTWQPVAASNSGATPARLMPSAASTCSAPSPGAAASTGGTGGAAAGWSSP